MGEVKDFKRGWIHFLFPFFYIKQVFLQKQALCK